MQAALIRPRWSSRPPTFATDAPKDTLRNVEATGEFVVNLAPYELAERMNKTSTDLEYGISEFEEAGLTPLPSQFVKPYRVAESPIQMECRLFQIVRHGEGALAANYVIGEVLCFHVATHLLKEGPVVDNRIADFIGRMGESWYCRATPRIDVLAAAPVEGRVPAKDYRGSLR
jgi:flavin reductase (DIM6/NTAB) family NADH-FMN oxidoreductase RutF